MMVEEGRGGGKEKKNCFFYLVLKSDGSCGFLEN